MRQRYQLPRLTPGAPDDDATVWATADFWRRRRLARLWLDDRATARLGPGKMDRYVPEHSRFTLEGGIASLNA